MSGLSGAVREEIDALLGLKAELGRIPAWALEAAAFRLGYCPGYVRKLIVTVAGKRNPPWEFAEWLLPVLYAHGSVSATHADLMAVRDGFVDAGEQVPAELAQIPRSYVTFWRAYDRMPDRFKTFSRHGLRGVTQQLVFLRWQAERRNELWQADCCKLDIWVRPSRGSRPVRPWLIVFLDDRTRLVMGALLCMAAAPTAEDTAAAAVQAMILKTSPDGSIVYGGRPDRIVWDNGPEFRAELVVRLAAAAGFSGTPALRYSPWQKGKIERFFRTFQYWVLASLPGWSKSPRLSDGTPVFVGDPSQLLTDEELWAHIAERIDYYNWRRPHSALGRRTPGEVWASQPDSLVELAESARLMGLLRTRAPRRAHKDGVAFANTKWLALDDIYDDWVGARLGVGYLPHDRSQIQLFSPKGDPLCPAYDQNSFTPEELYAIINRRDGHVQVIEGAARAAHDLRLARAAVLRRREADPGFVTIALARRTGTVAAPDAKPAAATPKPDEAFLAASRRALRRRDRP